MLLIAAIFHVFMPPDTLFAITLPCCRYHYFRRYAYFFTSFTAYAAFSCYADAFFMPCFAALTPLAMPLRCRCFDAAYAAFAIISPSIRRRRYDADDADAAAYAFATPHDTAATIASCSYITRHYALS